MSSVAQRRTAARRPACEATSTASAITTGSNSALEYTVALASASATPPIAIRLVASPCSPAPATHQVASASRNMDIAS